LQNRGWDGCLSLATWPAMGKRERVALMGKGVEFEIFVGKLGFCRIVENGKSFNLARKERKIEKRKMEKNWINEDIFLVSKNENIRNTDSRVKVEHAGKYFGKYRNRPRFKYLGTTRNFHQKSIII